MRHGLAVTLILLLLLGGAVILPYIAIAGQTVTPPPTSPSGTIELNVQIKMIIHLPARGNATFREAYCMGVLVRVVYDLPAGSKPVVEFEGNTSEGELSKAMLCASHLLGEGEERGVEESMQWTGTATDTYRSSTTTATTRPLSYSASKAAEGSHEPLPVTQHSQPLPGGEGKSSFIYRLIVVLAASLAAGAAAYIAAARW